MAAPEGNDNSTLDKRMITNALRRAAAQNPEKLRSACLAILDKAAEGDIASFNVYADRLDGKPIQGVEMSGPDGGPIDGKWTIEITRAKDTNT